MSFLLKFSRGRSPGPPSNTAFGRTDLRSYHFQNPSYAPDWSDLLCGLDIDTAVSNFSSVLESSLSVCSSHRDHQSTTRNRSSPLRQDPPLMTPVLRAGIKRKHDLYSIYKKYPTPSNATQYKRQRNIAKNVITCSP